MSAKRYKLYKDGKSLVIGAIAVAGVIATTSVQSVSADTTTTTNGNDTQAVKTTDVKQDGKQVALQPTKGTENTPQVKSDVPTSVPNGTTQDKAKETVDKAQGTVKGSADDAKKSGVEVTQKPTQDVTINQGNAVDETNKVLSDLNKQDQAIKQATVTQQANTQAKQQADTKRDEAVKQGQSDLGQATTDLKTAVDKAKTSGVEVTEKTETVMPKFKDLKGLTGKALTDAMAHNIAEYNKAIEGEVSKEKQDTKTIQALRQQRDKAMANYRAELARVNKVNADLKADFDKKTNNFNNGVEHKTSVTAKTSTDMASGQYQTFMTSSVNQATGDFELKHDMNDGVNIIGNGVLSGRVIMEVKSNGDGTETVTIKNVHLNSYTYTNRVANSAVNQNINFHVYDVNGKEIFSVYHDGNVSFNRNINQDFVLNKTFKLAPGQKSSDIMFISVDDNWIYNTHGNVVLNVENTNVKPTPPTYEKEPVEPAPLKGTATYYNVVVLPKAETPEQQKVSFNLYNVKTTPVSVETQKTPETPKVTPTVAPAPQAKVTQASALPQTSAKEQGNGSLLGALATIGSLSLLGVMSKFKKKH
ncbi:KxYKxGKxW signal peptide domain-containing protein [Leuconostoc citreum]|uniref:KxYKxGKxW signal peptide domain-containing protein n=1 Tax=Leuconostoc citreum TaxID=33964 RepID=UPI000246673A|nr:KxYKxGKxW signal peptide domain-containing protein [Leuconostoc citreum]CCF27636.1 Aggregation substance [Leuconostoc citreum LBAE C11]